MFCHLKSECYSFYCHRVIVLISRINAILMFAGGSAVPQNCVRGCTGPDLQATSSQPHWSPLTTDGHRSPVGACQLSPTPAAHLPFQEILSPLGHPAYLVSEGCIFFYCPPYKTLSQNVLDSLPWAFKMPVFWHILWRAYLLLYCTAWCHYLCLVFSLEVFVFIVTFLKLIIQWTPLCFWLSVSVGVLLLD